MAIECDSCGACCRFPIIEIYHLDVVREPRLAGHAKPLKGFDGQVPADPWDREYLLAAGVVNPCPMVGEDNLCTIYPTRPTCCVTFQAGSYLCTEARLSRGLDPLPGARLEPEDEED